ncbi:hypothetical protein FisN_15Lu336 [Fistulifera solaris]|uniref:SWIM-type domain-containing protein n=1 Tax=Fistulifera solaris TaxID=1519565 RepID=A0A1Z5JZ88_FISSO|nr:hypothetical protein FisN_15Lu336 [Fistulifera solaris]|eukprot:GAX19166.1 hypothetical protein FisN_15Lu336 [Fistulifera solaris]
MIGLSTDTTSILWDHFHLLNFVWPKELGKSLFDRISDDARKMLNSKTKDGFDQACAAISEILIATPEKYHYFKEGFMNQPHKCASYVINNIPMSLGRKGDTPAEANHSSIQAHLGSGGSRELFEQVEQLLQRQHEIGQQHHVADLQYHQNCSIRSQQLSKTDPSESEALNNLSKYAYSQIWSVEKAAASNYILTLMPHNAVKVVRRGLEDGRIIAMGERCNCDTRISMGVQCRHEICMKKGQFFISLFAKRHLQEYALPNGYVFTIVVNVLPHN